MYKQEMNELKQRGSADVSYIGETVDKMIWEFMKKKGIEGLTLAIVQAPYIPRVVGYGFSDVKQKRLASANTMWPTGHISQGFVAVAIMQLYEERKINLDDCIKKYLSNLPSEWNDITIIELLRHSSGIADYSLNEKFDVNNIKNFEDLINLVKDKKLKFTHGTDVELSATNFLILTEIIEKVTGMEYSDFVTERQIKFLGLKRTGFVKDLESFNHEDISKTGNIHEYFKKDKKYIDPTEYAMSYDEKGNEISKEECSALKGFTDIWASAQDVSFWDIALAGSILIKEPENRALVYGSWKSKDGKEIPAVAGWNFYNHKGLMDIKGSVKGYSSFLSRFTDPRELVCVTLLANKEGIDFTNLARKIAGAFGGLLSTNYNDNEIYLLEGQFPAKEMVNRLEKELESRSIPVFAKVDHAKNAKDVGLELRETTLVMFGSPKVGTHLMQDNQSIGLELPLKVLIWEDENGSSWIGFRKIENMTSQYDISNQEIKTNMQKLLEEIIAKVANIY